MKYMNMFLLLVSLTTGQAAQAVTAQDEVAVLTYLKLKPGTEARFQEALDRIVRPSLAEPGNIAWYVQKSVADPSSIVFYTRWKSEEALQIHLRSKPVADYITETRPFLEAGYPQLVRFRPIDQIREKSPEEWDNCRDCSCCP